MRLNEQQLKEAAQAICNSREFCGDEREAFYDWCSDNGIKPSAELYRQANFRASAQWRNYQKQAGVPQKYIY